MKIVYDPTHDILQISLREGTIEETTQIAPGVIFDYDKDDNVIGIELRKASQRLDNPYSLSYVVGEVNTNKPQPKR